MSAVAAQPWADATFASMGTHVRLVVGPGPLDPERALADARAWLQDAALRLSRFEPGSELCALNADPRREVPASALLRAAVGAGRWAAERTGGLVDPTLLGALERAGYERSRTDVRPVPLSEALAAAPDRRPARPHPAARWQEVEVRGDAVIRPPGVRLDTGGTGKGLLADALAHRLAGQDWATIDCGGDIRVTGAPFPVDVRHPLSGEIAARLMIEDVGIATSGLDRNVWRRPDGSFAHHLLDPSTGEPAWTGVVGATALAPTALEAETLAKLALLSGSAAPLAEHGGFIFHEDGSVEHA